MVEIALSFKGFPASNYKGPETGNSPSGFDCSGFVSYCLRQADYILSVSPTTGRPVRHTEEFFDFYGILVHDSFRTEGDLVFFSKNFLRPTHMGIYLSEDLMIHSPGIDHKVVEIITSKSLFQKEILTMKAEYKQIYSRNPIGYKRPAKISTTQRRFQKI